MNYKTWKEYGHSRELRKEKIEKIILLALVGGFAVFVGITNLIF